MQKTGLPQLQKLYTIETQRLIIRIDTEEGYKQAFSTMTDEQLKEYLGIDKDADLQFEKSKIACGLTTYRTSVVFFHLTEKACNKVIGSLAFHNWYPVHRRSEIGYAMRYEAAKNKGYMKEAFPHIVSFGFNEMELNRMEACIHPDNIASRRLVEGAGFVQEALLQQHYAWQGAFCDSVVYRLLREEYKNSE